LYASRRTRSTSRVFTHGISPCASHRLESSVQCTSARNRNWSKRPSDDRRARIRPGQRSHATRPSPKSAWPCLHRSVEPAEGPGRRASCAGHPRVRACAQLGDRCSTSERHDFPCSEVKRGGTPAGFDGPREHRQPDTSAANIGAAHCRRSAAIHVTPAATFLDPDVIRWDGGIAQSLRPKAGSREQAGYTSREDPHSDPCPSVD
jgi:hypothetical protein